MNKRILLADDSLTIQKVVELTFMDESFDVVAVGSGDEAIASLEADSLDILVADVHMPGPSGYEVCRRAKELFPSLPVLLLVGTFETLDEDEMAACGADGFLKKPFDSQELLEVVRTMTSGNRAPASSGPQAAPAAGFDLGTAQDLATPPVEVDLGAADLGDMDLEVADLGDSIELDAPGKAGEIAATFGDEIELSGVGGSTIEDEAAEISVLSSGTSDTDGAGLGDGLDLSDEPELGAEPTTDWELSSYPPPTPDAPTPDAPAAEALAPEPLTEEPLELESLEPEPLEPGPFEPGPSSPEASVAEPAIAALEDKPAASAALEDEPAASAADGGSEGRGLSDEEVERVARRVVALLADDTLREVAWDVIPDMAEIVIKDRIRELEAEAE